MTTGTVMRPDTLRAYARQAGFEDLTVLPIEDFGFWRFYELIGGRDDTEQPLDAATARGRTD